MSNIPPKIVKHHVESRLPARDPANGGLDLSFGGIERTPESLPVLEAFQSFLDAERKKTRKRIMAVSVFFLILIGVASGAAVMAGMLLAKQVKKDVSGMRDEVSAVRSEARKYQQDVEKALSSFTTEAEKLREEVKKETAAGSSELTSQVSSYNEELAELKTTLQTVENENTVLRGDLTRLQTGFPAFSNDIHRVIQELLGGSRRPPAAEVGPVAVAQPVRKAAGPSQDLIIALTPANSANTVAWCIPIPE